MMAFSMEEEARLRTMLETQPLRDRQLIETVSRIENLVTQQNGRVGKLELWRSFITGAVLVIMALLSAGIIKFGSAVAGG